MPSGARPKKKTETTEARKKKAEEAIERNKKYFGNSMHDNAPAKLGQTLYNDADDD